uniref:Ubiquitin-like domain-containing protein n=1 Tax=Ciona savignyi TaxID=51511 RepID=H2ZE58_CIOSA
MSSTPYLIDGIGDEVTIAFGLLIGFTTIVLAWMSTRVSERHYDQFAPNTNSPAAAHQLISLNPTTINNVELNGGVTNDTLHQSSNTDEPTIQNEEINSGNDDSEHQVASSSRNVEEPNEENLRQRRHAGSSQTRDINNSNVPEQFSIRLKFLDETVRVVQARTSDTVGEFRRQHFPVATAHRYRMIFQGQVLRDEHQTLLQCRIGPNLTSPEDFPVVHCFLSSTESDPRAPRDATSQIQQTVEELNIGHFFLPMLGSMLTLLLYLCVYHTSLFTLPALFGVAGLACFFIVLIVNQFL